MLIYFNVPVRLRIAIRLRFWQAVPSEDMFSKAFAVMPRVVDGPPNHSVFVPYACVCTVLVVIPNCRAMALCGMRAWVDQLISFREPFSSWS